MNAEFIITESRCKYNETVKLEFVELNAKCKAQNAKRRNCVAIIIKPI